jgi:glycosyltransferase involved in cell wall biosynthesis
MLEAMASGLPVVSLDAGGNRDIIVQGKNGYIVYEQNAELFADTIIELIEDNDLYKSISAYAVEFASKFDIKPYTDRLFELYQSKITALKSFQ